MANHIDQSFNIIVILDINFKLQVLHAYCNMLHILRPVKAPGFAYAWLEIVSHRVFMGRILATNNQPNGNQKGIYIYYCYLLPLHINDINSLFLNL